MCQYQCHANYTCISNRHILKYPASFRFLWIRVFQVVLPNDHWTLSIYYYRTWLPVKLFTSMSRHLWGGGSEQGRREQKSASLRLLAQNSFKFTPFSCSSCCYCCYHFILNSSSCDTIQGPNSQKFLRFS